MPAAKGKPAQTKDPYAAQGKALAAQVQRLRGWLSTDAGRLPELVDALNALVAHRLDGHAYAAAGAEAQEAVKRSAEHLLASGPVGPYSSAPDAVRCGASLVQLAALQAGIGLVEGAGATLASWDGLRAQVVEAGTAVELEAATGRRALLVAGRVALAEGDAALANAYADAAHAVPRPEGDPGFVEVDVDRLASDARWAGGLAEQSLGFLHSAKEAYERAGGDRLDEPGRLAPALAERLSEPLPALYRDLADRLGALGERDLALANRRLLVDRLRALVPRVEALRPALVAALTDLASDLLVADRPEEALGVATDVEAAAGDRTVPAAHRLLATAVLARASLAAGHPAPAGPLRGLLAGEGEAAGPAVRGVAAAALAEVLRAEGLEDAARSALDGVAVSPDQARGVVGRGGAAVSWSPLDPARAYGAPLGQASDVAASTPTWLEQERAEAQRQEVLRAEEVRREAEAQAAAEAREQEAARVAAAARATAEAEERVREETRRLAEEEAEQAERKRRREERLRQHRAEVDERERAERDARRAEIDARLADLDAAEEQERDRLLAERGSLDAADAIVERTREPEPATLPEPVEGRHSPEPATTHESAPATTPERVEGPPEPAPEAPAPTAPEPDELAEAEAAYATARTSGGRRETRSAAERVVELLRPRAAADPAAYDARLRIALENLAGARLRTGDIFGSRAATRESRTLA